MISAERIMDPIEAAQDGVLLSVFSNTRELETPELDDIELPTGFALNTRLQMDAQDFLAGIPESSIPVAFLDPQYRGVLDKLNYGNEGEGRGRARCDLDQMDEAFIASLVRGIDRILTPSGHLFLWIDKFHLCTGFADWLDGTSLETVDLITWNKERMGMGYRARRFCEYLIVLQKLPKRAKGVWSIHNIPDVWSEKIVRRDHAHQKPINLQGELIAAVSNVGDIVVDPAAGSFSVMEAAQLRGRNFLGCDING